MVDWLDELPDRGVGLLVTQFHESPPSPWPTAPAGRASSTQIVLFVIAVRPVGWRRGLRAGALVDCSVAGSSRTALFASPVGVGPLESRPADGRLLRTLAVICGVSPGPTNTP